MPMQVLPSVPRRVSLSGSASGSAPVAHPSRRVALFDFYLGKRMSVTVNELAQVVLPCRLLHVVLRFRAQRLGQPLLLPPDYRQLEITPLQLQRFLRGCVLSISHALVAPPACVFCLVPTRTKCRWIDCIFMRVMSGFAARAMVRRREAPFVFRKRSHGLAVVFIDTLRSRRWRKSRPSGYDAMAGGAQASSVCCRPPLFNTFAPLRVDDFLLPYPHIRILHLPPHAPIPQLITFLRLLLLLVLPASPTSSKRRVPAILNWSSIT